MQLMIVEPSFHCDAQSITLSLFRHQDVRDIKHQIFIRREGIRKIFFLSLHKNVVIGALRINGIILKQFKDGPFNRYHSLV